MATRKKPGTSLPTKCDGPPVDPARVEQTVQWMISGARDGLIVDAIRQTWPDQNLRDLIQAALAQFAESANYDRRVIHGFCFEATKDLYRRMVEIGDFAGALRAVKLLRELTT